MLSRLAALHAHTRQSPTPRPLSMMLQALLTLQIGCGVTPENQTVVAAGPACTGHPACTTRPCAWLSSQDTGLRDVL